MDLSNVSVVALEAWSLRHGCDRLRVKGADGSRDNYDACDYNGGKWECIYDIGGGHLTAETRAHAHRPRPMQRLLIMSFAIGSAWCGWDTASCGKERPIVRDTKLKVDKARQMQAADSIQLRGRYLVR